MIALLLALGANAQQVHSVEWARPFVMEEGAVPWTMHSEQTLVSQGWILQLRVDPDALLPLQTGVPNLYVGASLPARVNWDHEGGCAVVLVPGPVDLKTAPVYFSGTELPERLDGEARSLALQTASQGPLPAGELAAAITAGGPELRVSDLRGVYAAAAIRASLCSPQKLSD